MTSRTLITVVAVACAAAVAVLWWLPNRPLEGVPAVDRFAGITFSPHQADQDPTEGAVIAAETLDRDLALLARVTDRVRLYSVLDGHDAAPALARRHGLTVMLNAWLDRRRARNDAEIERLIALARGNVNVDCVLVGNEALLRGDVTPAELIGHLRRVRAAVAQPVSAAEIWSTWLEHPELADEVDFIAAHVLPYWDGVAREDAIEYVLARTRELAAAFPGKPVVLTEVGWPSAGRTRHGAVASPAEQTRFLREFAPAAEAAGLDYYVIEGFDQPWKAKIEGAVGAYWGLFDAEREEKVPLAGSVVRMPEWPWLAATAIATGLAVAFALLRRSPELTAAGVAAIIGAALGAASLLVWAAYVAFAEYATPLSVVAWSVLGVFLVAAAAYLLLEVFDAADLLLRRRRPEARRLPAATSLPMVSVHLPICNEPPEMVQATLRALAALDYPDFEVVVVDNNTSDPALWHPVEAACGALGSHFRFVHIERLAGFKAGALNLALARSDPRAQVIAVIDSDYQVARDWLSSLVPCFTDPAVALVQAPQDYRDGGEAPFKAMCYWEYAAFFRAGMLQRDERDAIIEHGTMTLVRRQVLEALGGWAEWCICEDAELGLRFHALGACSVYVPQSYGRSVMPDSVAAYKGQRHRWAYGAVQILKRHARALLGGRGARLTGWQRFHYVFGWLPWLADGAFVVFTTAAVLWTAGMVFAPGSFDPPRSVFLVAPATLFAVKMAKTLATYRARVGCGPLVTLGAMIAATALCYTVGRAVLAGLLTSARPFLRTPKCERRPALVRALVSVREEAAILVALAAGAIAIWVAQASQDPAAAAWAAMLALAAVPYAAAATLAAANAWPALRRATRPWLAGVPAPAE